VSGDDLLELANDGLFMLYFENTVLNLRFSRTRAFLEKLINFTGKNYNRSGLGFFFTHLMFRLS
jgi:hypothetical protein